MNDTRSGYFPAGVPVGLAAVGRSASGHFQGTPWYVQRIFRWPPVSQTDQGYFIARKAAIRFDTAFMKLIEASG